MRSPSFRTAFRRASSTWVFVASGAFAVTVTFVAACGDDTLPEAPAADAATPEAGAGDAGADVETPPVSCDAGGEAGTCVVSPITLEDPFSPVRFTSPVDLVERGGTYYVVEQAGLVRAFRAGDADATTVVDLTASVTAGGEAGLLGLALHPAFPATPYAWLSFTREYDGPPPEGFVFRSIVARYETRDGGRTLDPASEVVALEVAQPFANHNGGKIAFGPDGFLYVGLGDGGSGGDPQGNGQNPDTLLGKMLRLDVSAPGPAVAPPDNPFVGGGARPEIWATGLRNPWRFSFDRETGTLFAGDVGQGFAEEIDRIERGKNYGWSTREGKSCYGGVAGCESAGFTDPVVDYGRSEGASVTGGVVYRGTRNPALRGTYLYGDFVTGRIWGFDASATSVDRGRWLNEALMAREAAPGVAAFAEDAAGDVYVLDYGTGRVLRVGPASECLTPCR